jgi:periplasmic copper chaperone A
MSMKLVVRLGLGVAGTLAALLLTGSAASAHVTVTPATATQGEDTELTFTVPNEKDSANTVRFEIDLPADAPIASVVVRPVPGWSARMTTTKLATAVQSDEGPVDSAVTKVVWTASAGAAIRPGQYQDFFLAVGPLPEVDRLIIKSLQTYSDGDVVRWIDEPNPGGAEPEHPAMVLTLARADRPEIAAPAAAGSGSGGAALVLSLIALAVALGAAGLGVVNLRRSRS